MNDFELESELKSVRVPARTEEYWEDFPARVGSRLRRPLSAEPAQPHWSHLPPQWRWSGGLALACVMLSLSLWPACQAILKDGRALQRDAERFPKQLHLLMADQHGMQYLVGDRE